MVPVDDATVTSAELGGTDRWTGRSAGWFRPVATRLAERFSTVGVLIILIVVFSLLRPDTFFQYGTVRTLLTTQSVLGLVALAAVFPLVAGEFDLSVAALSGFSGMVTARLVDEGLAPVLVLLVVIGIGVAIGLVHGLLINRAGVESFITTLGTSVVLSGLVLWVSAGRSINMPRSGIFDTLITTYWANRFPVIALYLGIVAVVSWILIDLSAWGRLLRVTGASPRAARLIGIATQRLKTQALVVAGMIAALSGLLNAGLYGSASPATGPPLLLPAFAAAFVGSTTISPGRFNVFGTLIAIYLIAVGVTGLQMLGAEPYIEPIFYGLALIIAVGLSVRTRRAVVAA